MKVRTIVRLPDTLHKYVAEFAKYKGISMNAVMPEALWQFVERNEQKEIKQYVLNREVGNDNI